MRKILSISDFHGEKYVKESKSSWKKRGCEVVEMDYESVVAENNFSKYSLIILTMNHHNCLKYHKYAENLRSLTNSPIVIFPYGNEFTTGDLSNIAKDSDELMTLPTNIDVAIQNCIRLMEICEMVNTKNKNRTVIYEDSITLDIEKYIVTVDEKEIELSKTECGILYFLMKHRNHFMTYNQIYRNVWGEEYCDNHHNVLWNQISNLRKKLEWNHKIPHFIITKRGVGYSFNPEHRHRKIVS